MHKNVTVPITVRTGNAMTVNTTSLTQAHGTTKWHQVSVSGRLPGITSLTARVSAPGGISVVYPNDGTSSSLSQGANLDSDTTDYFAFQTTVGPSVAPGSYNLTVTMSYGSGSQQVATVPLVMT
jgi:hypothetical protein